MISSLHTKWDTTVDTLKRKYSKKKKDLHFRCIHNKNMINQTKFTLYRKFKEELDKMIIFLSVHYITSLSNFIFQWGEEEGEDAIN